MSRHMRVSRGRVRKVGTANKTEARYADYLELQRIAGEVLWYKFEGVNLRLAEKTFIMPDYLVLLPSGELEAHEVKAGTVDKTTGKLMMLCEDASKAKIKIASEMYPFRFVWVIEKPKKIGGGWELRTVGAE